MIEIKNDILHVDGHPIGNEEKLLEIFDKSNKYDELKASFKQDGDA